MPHILPSFVRQFAAAAALLASCHLTAAAAPPAGAPAMQAQAVAPWEARFGRTRPLVAVVGENSGTVLPDYVIPYAVLAQSGLADVVSLATQPGLLKLPPLQIRPDHTVAEFDLRYPEGADYVFVPAVNEAKRNDPTLLAWLNAQAAKGATMVSICNGAIVMAHAGLTRGHRATGHFSTHKARVEKFPDTTWLQDLRYVVDGKLISSAGISAAMPTSLAIVEAIGGSARAATLARQLGVADWSTRHDSQAFRFGWGDYTSYAINTYFHRNENIGIPLAAGIDEISLAFVAEAYNMTFRTTSFALSERGATVRSKNGLFIVPDNVGGKSIAVDRTLPAFDTTPPARMLPQVIREISQRYGAATAHWVILDMEYPGTGE